MGVSLTDLLFPWRCAGCGQAGSLFCDLCAQRVTPMPADGCTRCGNVIAHHGLCPVCAALANDPLSFARSAALHEEPLRGAIHRLKYERQPELAPLLARYLVAAWRLPDWETQRASITAVVPVPLHAGRQRVRGYNQAHLLAHEFCLATGLRIAPTWIARTRDTRPQVGLNAQERRQNVHVSFQATADVGGQTLLLVDDVFTTGATLRDCARAALDAGAAAVFALTLARPRLLPHDSSAISH
jgi:ComF family protein